MRWSAPCSWACNALFGRCGRALLAPILRRATNIDPRWVLKARLRRTLGWRAKWLRSPEEYLVRSIPSAPRSPKRPAVSYSDASTEFGLGAVLFLPDEMVALWFRMPCPPGDPINLLEVEAAAVPNVVFGPVIRGAGYSEDLAFVDNNVSLAWVPKGRPSRAVTTRTTSWKASGCRWPSGAPLSGGSGSSPGPTWRTSRAGAFPPRFRAHGYCG